MTTRMDVKTATELDINAVIDALKLAFVSDPVARWFWPDSPTYLSNFFRFAIAFGGRLLIKRAPTTLEIIRAQPFGFPMVLILILIQ